MNIRPGIKLLKEIGGYGDPIIKGDRFEAVYKFYYNKGDPTIVDINGKDEIARTVGEKIKTNIIYDHNGWLERQSEILPGLYYSLLGMRTMGYRFVRIAPHFMANSIYDNVIIKKDMVIKAEIYLLKITNSSNQS